MCVLRPHDAHPLKSLSHEDIKAIISTEVRDQLIETSKSNFFETSAFPPVKTIPEGERLRILVTGGSGFVGSHLVDRLMMAGHQVIVVDNMFTGRKKNVAQWLGHPNFQLIIHDVVEPIMLEVDQIYHLACPASPPHYQVCGLFVIQTSAWWYRLAVQPDKNNKNEHRRHFEYVGIGKESSGFHLL